MRLASKSCGGAWLLAQVRAVGPDRPGRRRETRPATTTTTAAGPRWTLASVELAAEEGRGGRGGFVGEGEGMVFAVSESNRTAR